MDAPSSGPSNGEQRCNAAAQKAVGRFRERRCGVPVGAARLGYRPAAALQADRRINHQVAVHRQSSVRENPATHVAFGETRRWADRWGVLATDALAYRSLASSRRTGPGARTDRLLGLAEVPRRANELTSPMVLLTDRLDGQSPRTLVHQPRWHHQLSLDTFWGVVRCGCPPRAWSLTTSSTFY